MQKEKMLDAMDEQGGRVVAIEMPFAHLLRTMPFH